MTGESELRQLHAPIGVEPDETNVARNQPDRASVAPSAVQAADRLGTTEIVEVIVPGAAERDPGRYVARRRRLERTLAWSVPICLIGLWQLAASLDWIDVRFFPAPTTIATTAVDIIESGLLQEQIWISTKRILLGFVFGVIIGVAAGLLLGVFRTLRAALEPMLMALYTVPKLALLPLLLLIFGLGDTPKVIIVTITVFFFMWINVMESIISTPKGYVEAMQSFDASRWKMFRYVYLPHSLPNIFVSMRLCAGIAILVMVGVEFVQGGDGIGFLIWNSWSLFIARQMYVGIVAVALMGLIFSVVVKAVGRRVVPWAPNDKTHGLS